MANELKDNTTCGTCRFYSYTGSDRIGFCRKNMISTQKSAVCGYHTK